MWPLKTKSLEVMYIELVEKTERIRQGEMMSKETDFVFLIGIIYPYGELNIMGVYTSIKELLNAYQLLITEDARCLDEKYPESPVIYKIPVNQFLGKKADWAQMNNVPYFYENIEQITVDELKRHI